MAVQNQSPTASRQGQQPFLQEPPPAAPLPKTVGKAKVSPMEPYTIVGPANGFVSEYDGVINPYSGCTFGCSYCYASNFTRDSKAQQDWGKWVKVKTNALARFNQIVPAAMNNKVYYISTATDPYQPVERTAGITLGLLEAVAERHPKAKLVIQTRSPLAVRDKDLFLRIINSGGRVQVNMTVTTDNDDTRKTYEPGCPSIMARMKAIASLQEAGIQCCITLTPLLPITDMPAFVDSLKNTGVTRFIVQGFHMPHQGREGFIARTDARAITSTAEHFDCPNDQAIYRYRREYSNNQNALKLAFPNIGVGKKGFAPPF